ncbi:MAG: hypothetical protein KBG15_12225 [Kofleriaceae bacterium]|nr:hypothetical protein [Kofleriaceae bacterium]
MKLQLAVSVLVSTAVVTAGCGGTAKPKVQKPVVPEAKNELKQPVRVPPPVPAPVCVATGAAENRIVAANGNVSSAQFCIASQDDAMCYGVDLNTGEYVRLPARPDRQLPTLEAPTAQVNVTEKAVEICVGDAPCKALKYKINKATPPTAVAINQAGTVVAIAAGKSQVDVWDVASNKKVTSIEFAQQDYRCGTPFFVGDVLAISADVCAGPAARGALFTTTGKRIADIGGPNFGSYGLPHTQVEGNTWAFLEERAGKVVLQDVVTGKVISTVSLAAFWTIDAYGTKSTEPALGHPGESELIRGGPGKLIVVGGGPGPGSVAVIDLDNGGVKVTRASMCPNAR